MKVKKIREYFDMLDNTEIEYYKELELAIVIFLRGDAGTFDTLNKDKIDRLVDYIDENASILDLDKDEVDNILDIEY